MNHNGFWVRFWFHVGLLNRFMGVRTGRKRTFHTAERAFNRSLRLDADFLPARYERGLLYWREMGQPSRAIEDFDDVLRRHPDFTDALFMRAMAHHATGNYWAAADDLQAFLIASPYSRWADSAFSQLNNLIHILNDLPVPLNAGEKRLLS